MPTGKGYGYCDISKVKLKYHLSGTKLTRTIDNTMIYSFDREDSLMWAFSWSPFTSHHVPNIKLDHLDSEGLRQAYNRDLGVTAAVQILRCHYKTAYFDEKGRCARSLLVNFEFSITS